MVRKVENGVDQAPLVVHGQGHRGALVAHRGGVYVGAIGVDLEQMLFAGQGQDSPLRRTMEKNFVEQRETPADLRRFPCGRSGHTIYRRDRRVKEGNAPLSGNGILVWAKRAPRSSPVPRRPVSLRSSRVRRPVQLRSWCSAGKSPGLEPVTNASRTSAA
ncbi:hypothetical protein GCM10010211_46640 [Streptomyces albospinus]|uniref:Uncharacterized protein n=1 Tax=Streptomyces albospinus TaxID=285515 RepID=A0ABQ2V993_9ACTN|nr:hypothetical protein GCM10010211_46640 [Streptomyces albospinus]